jgi:hypothetical protein
MADFLARNQPYLAPGPTSVQQGAPSYNTALHPLDEMAFRQWLVDKKVPFDPNAKVTDYDMRGFWRGLGQGDPRAVSAIDPNDGRMHYPDTWKTPLHQTFSADSQYAGTTAPQWTPEDKLVSPGGRVLFDDRAPRTPKTQLGDM